MQEHPMANLKDLAWFADKSRWDAVVAKVPKTSPFTDPGIGAGCEKIAAMWKAVRWDHVNAADTLKAKLKPEQLADEKFCKTLRAEIQNEYKKIDAIAAELNAQAARAKTLLASYGNFPNAYLAVLKYAQQVIADAGKFPAFAEASENADLAAIDKLTAAAIDAKASHAQAGMHHDEARIRDAATARLATAAAVVALDKTAHAVADTLAKATAAFNARKPELKTLIAQGKKQIESAVPDMKKASLARSELETAIKALLAPPFSPATAAAGKDELAKSQKVATDMKTRQDAAEKSLTDAKKRLDTLAKSVK
jgi:hypothetical protein